MMFKRMREPVIVPQVPMLIEEPIGCRSIGCPICQQASWGRDVIVLYGYLNECYRDKIMAYKMPVCGCLVDADKFQLTEIRAEATFQWKEMPSK